MATQWDAAVKAENEARDIAERFYGEAKQVFDAHETGAADYATVLEREEGYDALTSAHYDRLSALLRAPAPSFNAVLSKLRLGCADGFFDGSKASIEVLSVITDDIMRLSGEA